MKASLLILGVLHRGNFHPYEIKRRIENALVECYSDLDTGTLYYAVRQLEKDGLISPLRSERVARGGMRTIYAITREGRRHFQGLLHGQFEAEGSVAQTLYGALLFLHLCDPGRVRLLVAARLARLEASIAKLKPLKKEFADRLSTGGEHLLRHIELARKLDRQWLKALLADIDAGNVRDVRDPSRLAAKD